jgi:hypothetical protein
MPRTTLARSPQLRRGQSRGTWWDKEDLGRRAGLRIKGEHRASQGGGLSGCLKRKKEKGERWRDAIFIPHESGARPVHAPCLMRRSRFPDTGLL